MPFLRSRMSQECGIVSADASATPKISSLCTGFYSARSKDGARPETTMRNDDTSRLSSRLRTAIS